MRRRAGSKAVTWLKLEKNKSNVTKGWRIRQRTGSKEPQQAAIRNLHLILQATGSNEIIFRVKPLILRNKCQFTCGFKK